MNLRIPQQLLRCVFAFLLVVCVSAPRAQQTEAQRVQALVPSLLPLAELNRRTMLQHPKLSAFDLDEEIHKVFVEAVQLFKTDIPAVKNRLEALQNVLQIVTLREVPNWEVQGLLSALARQEGRIDDSIYHRAYRVALIATLSQSGDGKSPHTAMKLYGLREAAAWFTVNSLKPKTKSTSIIDGKRFDVWVVEMAKGGEQEIYFDLSFMDYSIRRLKGLER